MGASMAANLQNAGHDLVINDIRPDAGASHLARGATWADSAHEVGAAADIVFTSLPGPPEVEAVATGENGLLAGTRDGTAWFDLSTNSPTLVRRLYQRFLERGLHVLDAPVRGGPAGAESG